MKGGVHRMKTGLFENRRGGTFASGDGTFAKGDGVLKYSHNQKQ